ncbi:flagellin [Methanococcus maripaludis]|uniref:Flagellin n=1 Tax=Methanococcus maripaludis OS7 TaxID=637915 RepID=A0A2Z5PTN6_METMI|nr:flagellin [Methanococcus maripaludis]BAP63867.1 flagellin B3 precursor [Methanococcus maripaludis OS7]
MVKKFMKNKKGAVGIGTLIIFIAMVLVAAIAASVIINTAGKLQHKASTVGEESTEQVASGIQVLKIIGHADIDSELIDKIGIIVTPNVGGEIDLSATVLTISDGDQKLSLVYAADDSNTYLITTNGTKDLLEYDANPETGAWPFDDSYGNSLGQNKFGIIVLQDGDESVTGSHPTINYGDKIVLAVNIGSFLDNSGIEPRTKITGEVIPEYGASGIIDFRAPSAFTDVVVELQ